MTVSEVIYFTMFDHHWTKRSLGFVLIIFLLTTCFSPVGAARAASGSLEPDISPNAEESSITNYDTVPEDARYSDYEKSTIVQEGSNITVIHTISLANVSKGTTVRLSSHSPAVQTVNPGRFKKKNALSSQYSWTSKLRTSSVLLTFSYVIEDSMIIRIDEDNNQEMEGIFIRDYRQFRLSTNHDTSNFSRYNSLQTTGIITTHMAYLGHFNEYTVNRNGAKYSLIIPDTAASSLYSSPQELITKLSMSGETLSASDYHREITIVAAPRIGPPDQRAGIFWPSAGEGWVSASASERTFPSAWYHEIVHAAQPYWHTIDAKWFIEGSAEYYGVVLPDKFSSYDGDLQRDLSLTDQPSVVLTNQSTWNSARTPYDDGSVLVARLDMKIRDETNGSETLADLLRAVATNHSITHPVTNEDIVHHVEVIAGSKTANWLTRHTTSSLDKETRNQMKQQLSVSEVTIENDSNTEVTGTPVSQPAPGQDPNTKVPAKSQTDRIIQELINLIRRIVS